MNSNVVLARSVRVAPVAPSRGVTLRAAPQAEALEAGRRAVADRAREWLVDAGRAALPIVEILEGLCLRLRDAGVPVERAMLAFESLHAESSGLSAFWALGEATVERVLPYGPRADEVYARSPFALAHQEEKWVRVRVPEASDESFGIVPDLKQAGFVDYFCIPIRFANNTENGLTLATRAARGFSEDDLRLIASVVPTLAVAMELDAGRRMLSEVLRTYVGDEPGRRILAGEVRRGQVTRIRSAILFADMRRFTALSMSLAEEAIADLLNAYYDCLVPAIESEGGEVLKYMGDGVLAIFRDRSDDFGGACLSALAAARKALASIDDLNAAGSAPAPVAAGIALHHGRAAFGNFGSGGRLDFTVIGRDVNIASRIGRLCAQLGRRLLVSRAFADQLWEPLEEVGTFELSGIREPHRIFAAPGI